MSDDKLALWDASLPATLQEQLTSQFYAWEMRGRGWQVWDAPVQLEPPFRPFLFHLPNSQPAYDDGRKPTFFSGLIQKLRGQSRKNPQVYNESLLAEEFEEPQPRYLNEDSPLVEIQLILPPQIKITKDTAGAFLSALSFCSYPLSFEVVGCADSITVQITCRSTDADSLVQQLHAYFPDAVQRCERTALIDAWKKAADTESVIIDFGLSHECMRPLNTLSSFDVDPLIGITGALAHLQDKEVGVFQVLFQKVHNPWAQSMMQVVTDWEGGAFFADAPEMVSLARRKVATPLFAAVVRVAAKSDQKGRDWEIAKSLGATLTQLANPVSNELIPLSNDDYTRADHERALLSRLSYRSGMLLNCDELVSLVHLPSSSVRTSKLKREDKKTKAAPAIASGGSIVLGGNIHQGQMKLVSLQPQQRIRHTYVVGASGTGKSTLLLNLILQDITNGAGIGVLDPHGDLIDQILGRIPEHRFKDVVLFDPSDEAYPVGFNILSAHSELEKNLLSSDLVAVFRRLSTSWGDQMTSVLGNAILALLESEQGGTLVELRRFLVEADFRSSFLRTVTDPQVVYYWQREFPLLSGRPQAPLLTRLDTFLRPKHIRAMVSQQSNRLDFGSILNDGKIFLAKLSHGAIGEENAYLLGTLLVSKLHQLAMARQEIPEAKRRDFYLYIDEFHNFVTPSMSAILSGARKYHLGLILAHQELRQLASRNDEVASAVITNPYTRICFQLGDTDAKHLENGFSLFEAKDLQNLGVGEAICRIERAEYDFNLKTLPLPEVDEQQANETRERVRALSREAYGTPRELVEAHLAHHTPAPLSASASERVKQKPDKARLKEEGKQTVSAHPAPPTLQAPAGNLKEPSQRASIEAAPLGRGGAQHKYLQQLIKRVAESKGYRATIEKQVLEGQGSVDVALEKEGRSIACEISVTSKVEYELHNIQKCLAAGFEQIILICSDGKILNKAKEEVESILDQEQRERVLFFTPEELLSFFEEMEAQEASGQDSVRGYKVKINYRAVSDTEKKTRRQAIRQTIQKALKRLKDSK